MIFFVLFSSFDIIRHDPNKARSCQYKISKIFWYEQNDIVIYIFEIEIKE